jgi:hypothetical protein
MYRKLIILKNSDSILDEDLENNFRNYDGKIEILNNFKTNIHVLFNQENYMNKLFNFEFIEMNTYLQISDRLLVNDSLIDKLNSDYSINYKSDELNIIKKSTKFNETYIQSGVDFINNKENIILDITTKRDMSNVTTLLFINKVTSFQEKVLNNLISSVKHGKLYIYCYIDNLKDFLKFDNITNIEYLKLDNSDKEYEHMKNTKLKFINNDNIQELVILDNNVILKEEIDLLNLLVNNDKVATTHFLSMFNAKYNNLWFSKDSRGYYTRSGKSIEKGSRYDTVYMNYFMYLNLELLRKSTDLSKIYDGINDNNIPLGDFDIVISNFITNNNMKITNIYSDDIGYIIGDSDYIGDKYMNLKDIEANRYCWLEEYIDSNCRDVLFNTKKPEFEEPIPWLFETRFAKPKFCEELKELVNSFDLWSDGTNNDSRLQSGYEPVPTVDVHLTQVGFRPIWDNMLKTVISPLCEKFFVGFNTKGTNISFVVKYSMDGQKELKPHHDASSYTINLALNDHNEYKGGGTHFIVSDYKKLSAPIGTMLIHPGRCTHYHEGLPITSGERYILVGFIE